VRQSSTPVNVLSPSQSDFQCAQTSRRTNKAKRRGEFFHAVFGERGAVGFKPENPFLRESWLNLLSPAGRVC